MDDVSKVNNANTEGLDALREVELGRRVAKKSDMPTEDRWLSFGWSVVFGSIRTY
jgi:hypothetical protein